MSTKTTHFKAIALFQVKKQMSLSNHINQKIQQVGFPASPEKNLIFGHSPRVIMAEQSQKLLQAEEGAAGAATNGWPVVQPLDDHSDVVETGRKGEMEPERPRFQGISHAYPIDTPNLP